jgi:hypothetical protein
MHSAIVAAAHYIRFHMQHATCDVVMRIVFCDKALALRTKHWPCDKSLDLRQSASRQSITFYL